jgi:hypothetical protein
LTIGLLVISPLSAAAAEHQSASVPAPLARHWQGTADETPGIYLGPVEAMVTLDLNPDGTFVQTWKQADRQSVTSGTWRAHSRGVTLESSDRSHARLTLERRDDTLYSVATEWMPKGSETTTAIELHPTAG